MSFIVHPPGAEDRLSVSNPRSSQGTTRRPYQRSLNEGHTVLLTSPPRAHIDQ
jgi:hypothetical protein